MVDNVSKTQNYLVKLENRIDKIENIAEGFLNKIEEWIFKDIAETIKKGGPDVKMNVAQKLMKADHWRKLQSKINGEQTRVLNRIFSLYKDEIDQLRKIYPDSIFKNADIEQQFKQLESLLKESTNVTELMNGSKYDLTLRVRAAQASLVTDNSKEIIKYMQREVGGSFKQTQTVFRTTQNDLYNRMRTNFFKSIKTKNTKRYIYTGVLDSKTRDFCRKHIGEIKTEKQWRAIKNGSGTSAWCCRGGYNCRHQILFVSELWTKEEVEELQTDMKEQGVPKLA